MTTTDVHVSDLKPGDTVTGIDTKEFPFPFVLNSVRPMPTGAAILTATHGWFGLVEPHHVVHKVA